MDEVAVTKRSCDHTVGGKQWIRLPDQDMWQCGGCSALFSGIETYEMIQTGVDADNAVDLVMIHWRNEIITDEIKERCLNNLIGRTLYKNGYPFQRYAENIEHLHSLRGEQEKTNSDPHFVKDDSDVVEYTPIEIPGEKTFHVSETGARKEVKEQRHSLIPPEALSALAEIYGRGAAKYDDNNWRLGYKWSASYDALQRHLSAFWAGENYDPESGQAHLMHAAWHCITLFTFSTQNRYLEFDDRWDVKDGEE